MIPIKSDSISDQYPQTREPPQESINTAINRLSIASMKSLSLEDKPLSERGISLKKEPVMVHAVADDISICWEKGKHLVKRPTNQFIQYGDPDVYDAGFELGVYQATQALLNKQEIDLIDFFQTVRQKIETHRENPDANDFGLSRNDPNCKYNNCYTSFRSASRSYGHALERALSLEYNDHFVDEESAVAQWWLQANPCLRKWKKKLRFALVKGEINGKQVPLTQYVFGSRVKKVEWEDFFGGTDTSYKGDNKESGIWLHTDFREIPTVMNHINKLISAAIKGDLGAIPRIHWWLVHLAHTSRGSGGIAEMVTNTLFRFHGIDLPSWKESIVPSVEVLLEPNENKFCTNYPTLFSDPTPVKAALNKQLSLAE